MNPDDNRAALGGGMPPKWSTWMGLLVEEPKFVARATERKARTIAEPVLHIHRL
jgi:hypothetical protein